VCHLCLPLEYEPDRKCRTRLDYERITIHDPTGLQVSFEQMKEWEDPRTEPGELLWPAGINATKVEQLKGQMRRAHVIAGQLQQRPTSPEGDMFQTDWFLDIVDKAPEAPACRAWDLASATGRKADYTAGVLGCYDGEYLYIIDVKRFKKERRERDSTIDDVSFSDAERYSDYHVRFETEGGAGGKDAAEMHAERLSRHVRTVIDKALGKPTGNEQTMKGWETWAEMLSRNRVRLVKAPWNQAFIDEHLAAPNGRNDDMIDAASRVARGLYRRQKRQTINRPLLLLTPDEQEQMGVTYGVKGRTNLTCVYCGGMGCNVCRTGDEFGFSDELDADPMLRYL
jgi:phage terminase large subunit-like protein